jgi:hypothetical protein
MNRSATVTTGRTFTSGTGVINTARLPSGAGRSAVAPAPLTPGDEPRRPTPHRRGRAGQGGSARLADYVELSRFHTQLTEVAVWTRDDGACWQDDATFVLRMIDWRRHAIGFTEPAPAELVLWRRELPGCDTELLWQLIGQPGRRIVSRWQRNVGSRGAADAVASRGDPTGPGPW